MRKNVFGRQLRRDANERKALFKNLLTSLVLEERITTTEAKAKAIKSAADKLVTKAKKGGSSAMRSLAPDIRHEAAAKLINSIAPRFMTRPGGYTRIIKAGRRIADNAPQVVMEWVERPSPSASEKLKVKSEKSKKNVKKVKSTKVVKVEAKASIGKPVKQAKATKSAAPKQMVTRQKKG